MGFLDMGPMEILFILIVALIIWGPRRIPEIARTLGRTVRTLRKATTDITATVNRELDMEDRDRLRQSRERNSEKNKEASPEDRTESADTGATSPDD